MVKSLSKLKKGVPVVFADGSFFYKKLAKKYVTHKKGFFILAPSGAGKTHFVKNQKKQHWIDGDILWEDSGAHPAAPWWTMGMDVINEVDQRSDVITEQAKKLGFWVMGASNFWLKPDAIVVPHWNTHKKYILAREKGDYDGGATTKDFAQVLGHRKLILEYVKKGVKRFKSIQEAVDYLASLNK